MGALMRIMEKVRAQHLDDFTYTWDTSYNKLLNRAGDDIDASARTTAYSQIASTYIDYPTYHLTTVNFILPRRYEYTTVFDGVARGNVKIQLYGTLSGAGANYTMYAKLKIHLKSITSGGTTATLASTAYTAVISTTATAPAGTCDLTVSVPFWLDLDNVVLNNDKRLLLSIDVELSGSDPGAANPTSGYCRLYYTVNTDNLFIELPIVP